MVAVGRSNGRTATLSGKVEPRVLEEDVNMNVDLRGRD